MTQFNIEVSDEQEKFCLDGYILTNISYKMLEYTVNSPKIKELSALRDYNLENITLNADILICNDKEIKEMNLQYRNIDKPTDVLSFALFADNPDSRIVINNEILLGEIIVSAETANKQAEENNKTLEEEIYFLISHGILHLLGFDHPTKASLNFMLKLQNEMLTLVLPGIS